MTTHGDRTPKPSGTKPAELTGDHDEYLTKTRAFESQPDVLLHAMQRLAGASPRAVLMLQRTYGNRATTRMLHAMQAPTVTGMRTGHDSAAVVQRETVTKRQEELAPDGSVAYGWNYQYSVRFTPSRCILTIKVKMTVLPHPDTSEVATAEECEKVKADTAEQFRRIWDNEFLLVETATNAKYALRTELEFVDSGEDINVRLHKGEGRDNRTRWYTGTDDGVSRAHELGHQLGLLDEYEDPGVEKRKDKSASGVHEDNSVMGNYEVEGFEPAEAKLRHGEHIAKDISDATGRGFSAVKPSGIEMFFRKLLW